MSSALFLNLVRPPQTKEEKRKNSDGTSTRFIYNQGGPTVYPSSLPGFFLPLYRFTCIMEPFNLPRSMACTSSKASATAWTSSRASVTASSSAPPRSRASPHSRPSHTPPSWASTA
ncbi:hypothetical protein B0H14DRAFT_3030840 [Mycena olivaceomarginata]|nr:hypothetical protein B0H14DRAFT_3030840 [Mycena olivaceomarginata]